MTLPFLRGRGGGDFGFCSPHSKCQTKSYIPQEARASEFPKDEVASPPLSGLSSLPLSSPPHPQVSSPQFWPRRPRQSGRRPQAHSSSHCHAAEIRDTSSGWAPAKQRFKLKSGRGGPGPQLSATCKGCLGNFCLQPLGWRSETGHWSSGCHTPYSQNPPPIPRFPKYYSEPQARDVATPNPHL